MSNAKSDSEDLLSILAELSALTASNVSDKQERSSVFANRLREWKTTYSGDCITLQLPAYKTNIAMAPITIKGVESDIFDGSKLSEPEKILQCGKRLVAAVLSSNLMCFTNTAGEPLKHFIPADIIYDLPSVADIETGRCTLVSRASADVTAFYSGLASGIAAGKAGDGRLSLTFVELPLPELPKRLELIEPFVVCNLWLPARTELPKLKKTGLSKYAICNILGVPHVRGRLVGTITVDNSTEYKGSMVLELDKGGKEEIIGPIRREAPLQSFRNACKSSVFPVLEASCAALLWVELRSGCPQLPGHLGSPLAALAFLAANADCAAFVRITCSGASVTSVPELVMCFFEGHSFRGVDQATWSTTAQLVVGVFKQICVAKQFKSGSISPFARLCAFCCTWLIVGRQAREGGKAKAGRHRNLRDGKRLVRQLLASLNCTGDEVEAELHYLMERGTHVIQVVCDSGAFSPTNAGDGVLFFHNLILLMAYCLPGMSDMFINTFGGGFSLASLIVWPLMQKHRVKFCDWQLTPPFTPTQEAAFKGSIGSELALSEPDKQNNAETIAAAMHNSSGAWICIDCGIAYSSEHRRCTAHTPSSPWPFRAMLLRDCSDGQLFVSSYVQQALGSPSLEDLVTPELHSRGLPDHLLWPALVMPAPTVPPCAETEHTISNLLRSLDQSAPSTSCEVPIASGTDVAQVAPLAALPKHAGRHSGADALEGIHSDLVRGSGRGGKEIRTDDEVDGAIGGAIISHNDAKRAELHDPIFTKLSEKPAAPNGWMSGLFPAIDRNVSWQTSTNADLRDSPLHGDVLCESSPLGLQRNCSDESASTAPLLGVVGGSDGLADLQSAVAALSQELQEREKALSDMSVRMLQLQGLTSSLQSNNSEQLVVISGLRTELVVSKALWASEKATLLRRINELEESVATTAAFASDHPFGLYPNLSSTI